MVIISKKYVEPSMKMRNAIDRTIKTKHLTYNLILSK